MRSERIASIEDRTVQPLYEESEQTRLAAERKWKQEVANFKLRVHAIETSNAAQFDLVTGEMFSRLYHEAFHAYLENFVYPLFVTHGEGATVFQDDLSNTYQLIEE